MHRQKGHRNHTNKILYRNVFRLIDLCILGDASIELSYVFGNFYASGTQHAEVTKSLLLDVDQ